MRVTTLKTREDLDWLSEVHGVDTSDCEIAVLYGNEDSPGRVEIYSINSIFCEPVVWIFDGSTGKLTTGRTRREVVGRTCERIAATTDPQQRLERATRLWNAIDHVPSPEGLWDLMAEVIPDVFADPSDCNSIRLTYASLYLDLEYENPNNYGRRDG